MSGSKTVENVRFKGGEFDERRLVEAAQKDAARFLDIYENYFGLVYGFVARRVRQRAETEDLTADVFRKALANLARFKWTGAPFGAWLIRIASNVIADRAKRASREGRIESGETASRKAELSTQSTQQKELEESERRAQLFSLIDELADDQRSVIVMRFAQEKNIGEIANDLGRSEGAIKQLQFRALQNLRAKLGKTSNA
jgi:RNA polymerase sigma-70 factor (ECF subfamily)